LLHDFVGMVTIVCPVGRAVVVVGCGEDEDVITASEGIFENGSGAQIDVGVVTRRLIGGGTIEIPDTKLSQGGDFLRYSLRREIMSCW
jgi:hypothetical protein